MKFAEVIKVFKSLRLTVFLIICLVAIFSLGLIIPQKDLLGHRAYIRWKENKPGLVSFLEFLHFTEIYTAPVTLALLGLFFLNLIVVMANRIPLIWNRCMRKDFPGNVDSVSGSSLYKVLEGAGVEDAVTALKSLHFAVFPNGRSFIAVKNRFSPLATILFHISFFLVLVGGVTSFYTKFNAEADVAVRETFTGQYVTMRPPKFGSIPRPTFMVEEIRPTYFKREVPLDLKVVLLTPRGEKTIGINRPYKEGALSFVVRDIDIAPLFVIQDREGRELDGAYVKLKVLGGGTDSFVMSGYEFKTVFHTDYLGEPRAQGLKAGSMPQVSKEFITPFRRTQPKEIVNPAFTISVIKDRNVITKKDIKLGESIEFDGHRLIFGDLTYWTKFYVVKEHGLGIIYAGFVLIIIALIVRFGFYRREIKGMYDEGKLHFTGRSEFFPSLFEDEFERLVDELRRKQQIQEHPPYYC